MTIMKILQIIEPKFKTQILCSSFKVSTHDEYSKSVNEGDSFLIYIYICACVYFYKTGQNTLKSGVLFISVLSLSHK